MARIRRFAPTVVLVVVALLAMAWVVVAGNKPATNQRPYSIEQVTVNGRVVERHVTDARRPDVRPMRLAKTSGPFDEPTRWGVDKLVGAEYSRWWSCITPYGGCLTTVRLTHQAVFSWYVGGTSLRYSASYHDGCSNKCRTVTYGPAFNLWQGTPGCFGCSNPLPGVIWSGDEWGMIVDRPFQSTIAPHLHVTLLLQGDGTWYYDTSCEGC